MHDGESPRLFKDRGSKRVDFTRVTEDAIGTKGENLVRWRSISEVVVETAAVTAIDFPFDADFEDEGLQPLGAEFPQNLDRGAQPCAIPIGFIFFGNILVAPRLTDEAGFRALIRPNPLFRVARETQGGGKRIADLQGRVENVPGMSI
jgi:hypothetical protein